MLKSPRSHASEPPISLPAAYPRCLEILESAIGDSLDHPADAYSRIRARDVALAMLAGCRVCGYREDSGILEAVAGILDRPYDTESSTVADLRERFRGLFGYLKSQALVRIA